jgi:transcription factor C subunit 6
MLSRGEYFDFGSAWGEIGAKGKKKGCSKRANKQAVDVENLQEGTVMDGESVSAPLVSPTPRPQKVREGWILNLGSRVQCLAWAPNCTGTSQYLAVSVPITEQQKIAVGETVPKGAPAFTPSAPYPAAIQIWSFDSVKVGQPPRRLDMSVKPRLRLVACGDAGDIKRLSWCPMPRAKKQDGGDEDVYIGLLGGIWGDGTVKVLDIRLNKKSDDAEYGMYDP